jgi:ubiquinone/menaquinone biosynthesis C-methylase UbiE
MAIESIKELLGQTDIYLIDQIMKDRYKKGDRILDAGCGRGRNLHWFLQNEFDVYGIDVAEEVIDELKNNYAFAADKFFVSGVERMHFEDNYLDHIICSAVLHFAKNMIHFKDMFSELVRVLKPKGTLFIRMTSDIGIEEKVKHLENGVYSIPDGSKRFLLTKNLLAECISDCNVSLIEPLKTVNVNDAKCVSTIMLSKQINY